MTHLDGTPLHKGFPAALFGPVSWEDWLEEFAEELRIFDLGEGFAQEEKSRILAQPGPSRAPELIFTGRSDHRTDLWHTGCMVCGSSRQNLEKDTDPELQLFFFVFGTYPFDSDVEDMVVVEQMIDLLGELPQEWQATWDRMREEAGDMMDFQGELDLS